MASIVVYISFLFGCFAFVSSDLYNYGTVEISTHGIVQIEVKSDAFLSMLNHLAPWKEEVKSDFEELKKRVQTWEVIDGGHMTEEESVRSKFESTFEDIIGTIDLLIQKGTRSKELFLRENAEDGMDKRSILETVLSFVGIGFGVANSYRITSTNNRLSAFIAHTDDAFHHFYNVTENLKSGLHEAKEDLITTKLLVALTAKAMRVAEVLNRYERGLQQLVLGQVPIEFLSADHISSILKRVQASLTNIGATMKLSLQDFAKLPATHRLQGNILFVVVPIPVTIMEMDLFHFKPQPIAVNESTYFTIQPPSQFIAIDRTLTSFVELSDFDLSSCFRLNRQFFCQRDSWVIRHNFESSCLGVIFKRTLSADAKECSKKFDVIESDTIKVFEKAAGNFTILVGKEQTIKKICGSHGDTLIGLKKGRSEIFLDQGCHGKLDTQTIIYVPEMVFDERLVINISDFSLNSSQIFRQAFAEIEATKIEEERESYHFLNFEDHPLSNSILIALVVVGCVVVVLSILLFFLFKHHRKVIKVKTKNIEELKKRFDNFKPECTHTCSQLPALPDPEVVDG